MVEQDLPYPRRSRRLKGEEPGKDNQIAELSARAEKGTSRQSERRSLGSQQLRGQASGNQTGDLPQSRGGTSEKGVEERSTTRPRATAENLSRENELKNGQLSVRQTRSSSKRLAGTEIGLETENEQIPMKQPAYFAVTKHKITGKEKQEGKKPIDGSEHEAAPAEAAKSHKSPPVIQGTKTRNGSPSVQTRAMRSSQKETGNSIPETKPKSQPTRVNPTRAAEQRSVIQRVSLSTDEATREGPSVTTRSMTREAKREPDLPVKEPSRKGSPANGNISAKIAKTEKGPSVTLKDRTGGKPGYDRRTTRSMAAAGAGELPTQEFLPGNAKRDPVVLGPDIPAEELSRGQLPGSRNRKASLSQVTTIPAEDEKGPPVTQRKKAPPDQPPRVNLPRAAKQGLVVQGRSLPSGKPSQEGPPVKRKLPKVASQEATRRKHDDGAQEEQGNNISFTQERATAAKTQEKDPPVTMKHTIGTSGNSVSERRVTRSMNPSDGGLQANLTTLGAERVTRDFWPREAKLEEPPGNGNPKASLKRTTGNRGKLENPLPLSAKKTEKPSTSVQGRESTASKLEQNPPRRNPPRKAGQTSDQNPAEAPSSAKRKFGDVSPELAPNDEKGQKSGNDSERKRIRKGKPVQTATSRKDQETNEQKKGPSVSKKRKAGPSGEKGTSDISSIPSKAAKKPKRDPLATPMPGSQRKGATITRSEAKRLKEERATEPMEIEESPAGQTAPNTQSQAAMLDSDKKVRDQPHPPERKARLSGANAEDGERAKPSEDLTNLLDQAAKRDEMTGKVELLRKGPSTEQSEQSSAAEKQVVRRAELPKLASNEEKQHRLGRTHESKAIALTSLDKRRPGGELVSTSSNTSNDLRNSLELSNDPPQEEPKAKIRRASTGQRPSDPDLKSQPRPSEKEISRLQSGGEVTKPQGSSEQSHSRLSGRESRGQLELKSVDRATGSWSTSTLDSSSNALHGEPVQRTERAQDDSQAAFNGHTTSNDSSPRHSWEVAPEFQNGGASPPKANSSSRSSPAADPSKGAVVKYSPSGSIDTTPEFGPPIPYECGRRSPSRALTSPTLKKDLTKPGGPGPERSPKDKQAKNSPAEAKSSRADPGLTVNIMNQNSVQLLVGGKHVDVEVVSPGERRVLSPPTTLKEQKPVKRAGAKDDPRNEVPGPDLSSPAASNQPTNAISRPIDSSSDIYTSRSEQSASTQPTGSEIPELMGSLPGVPTAKPELPASSRPTAVISRPIDSSPHVPTAKSEQPADRLPSKYYLMGSSPHVPTEKPAASGLVDLNGTQRTKATKAYPSPDASPTQPEVESRRRNQFGTSASQGKKWQGGKRPKAYLSPSSSPGAHSTRSSTLSQGKAIVPSQKPKGPRSETQEQSADGSLRRRPPADMGSSPSVKKAHKPSRTSDKGKGAQNLPKKPSENGEENSGRAGAGPAKPDKMMATELRKKALASHELARKAMPRMRKPQLSENGETVGTGTGELEGKTGGKTATDLGEKARAVGNQPREPKFLASRGSKPTVEAARGRTEKPLKKLMITGMRSTGFRAVRSQGQQLESMRQNREPDIIGAQPEIMGRYRRQLICRSDKKEHELIIIPQKNHPEIKLENHDQVTLWPHVEGDGNFSIVAHGYLSGLRRKKRLRVFELEFEKGAHSQRIFACYSWLVHFARREGFPHLSNPRERALRLQELSLNSDHLNTEERGALRVLDRKKKFHYK